MMRHAIRNPLTRPMYGAIPLRPGERIPVRRQSATDFEFRPDTRMALNRIRIVVPDGDRDSLHVKSTLDHTYKLDPRTDEAIAFTDRDLIAIKNCLESARVIRFEALRLPDGRRAILRPSRQEQSAYVICDREVSEIRSAITFQIGPGETIMLSTDQWEPALGPGSKMIV